MSKKFLVLAEAHGIQNYVFGSNRLTENIGASYLVGQWSNEILCSNLENILPSKGLKQFVTNIYFGGGNAMFEVETDDVTTIIHKLTREFLVNCPGLLFTVVYEEIKQPEQFKEQYKTLRRSLVESKRNRKNTAPQFSFSVTRRCESTGLPANGMTPLRENQPSTDFPANMEILQKYYANEQAREHLENLCAEQLRRGGTPIFTFPYQIDHLGRSAGEHSYMGVVHIDGDSMGKHLDDVVVQKDDTAARTFLDDFSSELKKVGEAALQNVVNRLCECVSEKNDLREIGHPSEKVSKFVPPIPLKFYEKTKRWFLPFRPLIYGGDDMTFVCDGRLGVALAIAFMKAFANEAQNLPGGASTASAGIAIVKPHYPFSRAYDLAVQLCRNAKDYKRRNDISDPCFDWHFALSGLAGDLEEIRKKEYQSTAGDPLPLYLRPYVLGNAPMGKANSWDNVHALVTQFQSESWLTRRNKMEKLKRALRDGEESVKWFRQKYLNKEKLPLTSEVSAWSETGWHNNKCIHFDALELADWYMPLEEEGGSPS